MKITNVEPIVLESAVGAVSMPGGKADFDATVRPVLVRVETDAGIVGLGESYLDDPTGQKAEFVAQGIKALSNHLIGEDPRNAHGLWHELYVHVKRSGSYRSLSAIDEALWDIKGKDADLPIYQLLGGKAEDVYAYATFPHSKPIDELIEAGKWLSEKGFQTMKIVVGHGIETDRERIRTVSEEIPDDLGLAMDANTSYNFTDAYKLGKTADEYEMEWFEEPIVHTDI
jgi:L-alanine-DL-glutamate epimerase-like enolase superfamily enzyme